MLAKQTVGRSAAAFKYDLLTVMGAFALAQEKGRQRLVLRLMTLVTARYNWARDELAVGQREIARLWQVDERTVKREMAKLRAMGRSSGALEQEVQQPGTQLIRRSLLKSVQEEEEANKVSPNQLKISELIKHDN